MKYMRIIAAAAVLVCLTAVLSFFGLLKGGESAAANMNDTLRGRVTLIIDAGHGGADGGAVAPDGTYESALNLDIAQKMEQILGLYGAATIMTRSSEELSYPDGANTISAKKKADQRQRLALIKSTENAVFISIHLNKYTSAGPHGSQVLYAPTEGSEVLSAAMQTALKTALNPERERQAAKIQKDIYLMNNIDCPAVLIECGFLSNPDEEKLLKTDAYRLKLASTIAAGYVSALPELEPIILGGTDES